MKFSIQQQNVIRALKQRNFSYLVIGCLLLSNLVLALKVLRHEERWVLIPQFSTEQRAEIVGSKYSDSYLIQWAGSLSRELMTVNPSTVETVSNRFLKIASTKFGQIQPYLAAHIKDIKENNISTVFYEKDCKILDEQSEVEVTGTFYTYLGRDKAPIIETKTFVVGWATGMNGALLVSRFEEKKEA